jgi:hypothetical protein
LYSIVAFCLSFPVAATEPLFVGIVDYIHNTKPVVAVAFKKVDGKWIANTSPLTAKDQAETLQDQPREFTWTVAFEGKNLGQLTSKQSNKPAESISDWGTQVITSKKIPIVGKKTSEFAGWSSKPTFRPLVVVSQANIVDPSQSKPKALNSIELKQITAAYRKTENNVIACDKSGNLLDEPLQYKDSDLQEIKAYRALNGDRLVGLRLNANLYTCDGPRNDSWGAHWFYWSKNGEPILLGKDLTPVDAGDYDGDGKAEFIFFRSRYNADGYILFADNFTTFVEYSWSYH